MSKSECDAFTAMLESQGSLVLRTDHFAVFLDRKQYYLGRSFIWGTFAIHLGTNYAVRNSAIISERNGGEGHCCVSHVNLST